MIYEHALEHGTIVANLRVDRVHRGNPLTYIVTCLREDCGGSFEIAHDRLTGLVSGFCQWPGCREAQRARERSIEVVAISDCDWSEFAGSPGAFEMAQQQIAIAKETLRRRK